MRRYIVQTKRIRSTSQNVSNYLHSYFRFDDDNNMGYRYIIWITYTEMGQLSTYSPIVIKIKGNR